ncbi:MAG: ATP-grasp domain-containing protein, partial [Limnochordales bacterium]
GYPVMIKAVAGGGGRGMRKVFNDDELTTAFERARSEAQAAFGNPAVYIEKAVERPKHIEVQVLADRYGNVVHLFERDCSIQRRHQKIVEIAPAPSLSEATRQAMGEAAVTLMKHVGYVGLATVEFLVDEDENFYFLEVNPRIQVEHTVTELITGVDLVQAQILVAQGHRLADAPISLPDQAAVTRSGVAIQCRVTTEDPANGFVPDHGRISAYRVATGFGVRVDDGAGYQGAYVSPHYDSLLAKVCTWDRTFAGASRKMLRALREFRVRGVKTNLPFLQNVVVHPTFLAGAADTGFVESHPELYTLPPVRDRGTRLLAYVGHASINNGPGIGRRPKPAFRPAPVPDTSGVPAPAAGTKQLLEERGPEGVARWMLEQERLLLTDGLKS